jgi:RNA polymerase sigma-70 factor (ECF subfamily)
MLEPDPDLPLLRRAQQGEMAAFELLVLRHQGRIGRLVARVLPDPDLVADVVQESFLSAYRALPGFRGESSFYTWLHRIALNAARKQLAALRRDPVQTESSLIPGEEDGELLPGQATPSEMATPETLLAGQQLAQALEAAVQGLPPEFREALLLREIEGLGYEEMAELLGCPVGTVRSRLHRAREAVAVQLRPLLETRGSRRW